MRTFPVRFSPKKLRGKANQAKDTFIRQESVIASVVAMVKPDPNLNPEIEEESPIASVSHEECSTDFTSEISTDSTFDDSSTINDSHDDNYAHVEAHSNHQVKNSTFAYSMGAAITYRVLGIFGKGAVIWYNLIYSVKLTCDFKQATFKIYSKSIKTS